MKRVTSCLPLLRDQEWFLFIFVEQISSGCFRTFSVVVCMQLPPGIIYSALLLFERPWYSSPCLAREREMVWDLSTLPMGRRVNSQLSMDWTGFLASGDIACYPRNNVEQPFNLSYKDLFAHPQLCMLHVYRSSRNFPCQLSFRAYYSYVRWFVETWLSGFSAHGFFSWLSDCLLSEQKQELKVHHCSWDLLRVRLATLTYYCTLALTVAMFNYAESFIYLNTSFSGDVT